MAGTRLFIQASVAIQFLLLVAAAVFFGLCQQGDDICALLFHSKDRRLAHLQPTTNIRGPAVSIVISDAHVAEWKAALEQRHETSHVNLVTSQHYSTVCSDAGQSEQASTHDLWICPNSLADNTNAVARVKVLPSGSSLVYPTTDKINNIVDGLIPLSSRVHVRKPLLFTLITQDSSWMPWSKAMTQVVESVPFTNLPCLKHESQMRVLVDGTLSESAKAFPKNNNTVHYVTTHDVEQVLLSKTTQSLLSNKALNIVIYVPSNEKMPMVIQRDKQSRQTSTSAFIDLKNRNQQAMITIANHREHALHVQAIRKALADVIPFLQEQCLDVRPDLLEMEPAGSVAGWQIKLAIHRLVADTHAEAYNELMRLHGYLMQSSTSVDQSGEATQKLMIANDMLDDASRRAGSHQWDLALDSLEASLQTSRAALTDENLMEPLDFPPEHAFAVFSPLLFPLTIPLVFGVLREVKRYKKLQKQNKTL